MNKHIGAYSSLHGPAGKSLTDYTEQNVPALWGTTPERITSVANTGAEYTGVISGWTPENPFTYTENKFLFFTPHVHNQANCKLSINGLPLLPIIDPFTGVGVPANSLAPDGDYLLWVKNNKFERILDLHSIVSKPGPAGPPGPKGDPGAPGEGNLDWINVGDYGLIADGASHPLSELYPDDLPAAKAVYPFATSLSQEIDYCACKKASNIAFGSDLLWESDLPFKTIVTPSDAFHITDASMSWDPNPPPGEGPLVVSEHSRKTVYRKKADGRMDQQLIYRNTTDTLVITSDLAGTLVPPFIGLPLGPVEAGDQYAIVFERVDNPHLVYADKIIDSSQSWTVDEHKGKLAFRRFTGSTFTDSSVILSNTATELTTEPFPTGAIGRTNLYAIGVGEHADQTTLNRPLWLPRGNYYFGDDTWLIRKLKGTMIQGAGENATVLRAKKAVMKFDGLWYTEISDFTVQCTETTVNANPLAPINGAFEIDGNVPGHPYETFGVQGVTVRNLTIDGNMSDFAFGFNRLGGNGGQGDQCIFDKVHMLRGNFACYYQIGFNSLSNVFLGGQCQDYPRHGLYSLNGSFSVLGTAFQSLGGEGGARNALYKQIENNGYDINFNSGAYAGVSIAGVRSESVNLYFNSGNTSNMSGCDQAPGKLATWGENLTYGPTANSYMAVMMPLGNVQKSDPDLTPYINTKRKLENRIFVAGSLQPDNSGWTTITATSDGTTIQDSTKTWPARAGTAPGDARGKYGHCTVYRRRLSTVPGVYVVDQALILSNTVNTLVLGLTGGTASHGTIQALPRGPVLTGDEYKIVYSAATAPFGSNSTINDTGQSWAANEHVGRSVFRRNLATGATDSGHITSNTATALTIGNGMPNGAIVSGDLYAIWYKMPNGIVMATGLFPTEPQWYEFERNDAKLEGGGDGIIWKHIPQVVINDQLGRVDWPRSVRIIVGEVQAPSREWAARLVTGDTQMAPWEEGIEVDATAGPITIYPPFPIVNFGKKIWIKKVDTTANPVTLHFTGPGPEGVGTDRTIPGGARGYREYVYGQGPVGSPIWWLDVAQPKASYTAYTSVITSPLTMVAEVDAREISIDFGVATPLTINLPLVNSIIYTGLSYKFYRRAGGVSTLTIAAAGLSMLVAQGEWVSVVFNGTAWVPSGRGMIS